MKSKYLSELSGLTIININKSMIMGLKSNFYYSLKRKALLSVLPLTLYFLPLTVLAKKIRMFLFLINILLYFCKKNQIIFFMLNHRGIILFFLLFISTNIFIDKCLGCEEINIASKHNISLNQTIFKQNFLSLTQFHSNASAIKRNSTLVVDSSFLSSLSEDDSENQPFINLEFSISNCVPDFKEDYHKLRFGMDDRSFHILMKHTTCSICMLFFNSQQEENYLSFVVPADNIILFRQIQI